MSRELDIILFGATGFTGYHAVPILHKLTTERNRNLNFGIAGRSNSKLKDVLSKWESILGSSLKHVSIIEADVNNQESLNSMARQGRLVVNCVGPFILYGEPVVKACIEEGTHYVDITAEQDFIELIEKKYHKKAEEKNIFVICTCGLDCIPADLGVVFLQQNFKGVVDSAELYFKIWEEGRPEPGPMVNKGTWDSVILVVKSWTLKKIFQQAIMTTRNTNIYQKILPHTDPIEEGWIIPFPSSDKNQIESSQRLLYENEKQRPVKAAVYYVAQTTKFFLGILLSLLISVFLCRIEFGLRLLQKFPYIFSFGLISNNPPSNAKINGTWYRATIRAKGWKNTPDKNTLDNLNTPNRTVIAQITGQNPGYRLTNYCMVLCAIKILTESDKLPKKGGVYPPGFAFAKTSLIEELHENKITFEIISEIDT